MITSLLRGALRFIAAVALFALGAVAVISFVSQPVARSVQPKADAPTFPPQTYSVPADVTMAPVTRDTYEAVMPPKPKPKPTATMRKAVVAPRKPVTVASAQSYARGRLGSTQYACLDNIAVRESGWNPYASNSASGAYGIPQSLPGSKMASAGSDWRTNPITQVKWMIGYVDSRYGSACGAWSYWQAHSNY